MTSPSLPHVAYIGLGANLGARQVQLQSALMRLGATEGVHVAAVSPFHETDPVGGPPGQPSYLNAAARLATSLPPEELLRVLLAVEHSLGRTRQRGVRNAPRTIDLDLLLYEDCVLDLPGLTLPHPRLHQRLFVLEPLAQVAPSLVHPVLQKTILELRDELRGQSAC